MQAAFKIYFSPASTKSKLFLLIWSCDICQNASRNYMKLETTRRFRLHIFLLLFVLTAARVIVGAYTPMDRTLGVEEGTNSISLSETSVSVGIDVPALLGTEVAGKVPGFSFCGWGIPLLPSGVYLQKILNTTMARALAQSLAVFPAYNIRELKFPTHYFW